MYQFLISMWCLVNGQPAKLTHQQARKIGLQGLIKIDILKLLLEKKHAHYGWSVAINGWGIRIAVYICVILRGN
jgi:hypothetical protein